MNKLIKYLIAVNLSLLIIIFFGKVPFLCKILIMIFKSILIPLIISTFIFYILRPLNNVFVKKGIGYGKSGVLTLVIFLFVLSGIITYFGRYAYGQFEQITKQLLVIIKDSQKIDSFTKMINRFVNINELYSLAAMTVKNYIMQIFQSLWKISSYFMNTFSMVFLIIVIVFYLLRDGFKFKSLVLNLIPKKYRRIVDEILSEGDVILSHYVTGQAMVAFSLAVMIFIGYKIIGMHNAMVLSMITFILAFIPFVGFFISMIIPTVIAIGAGVSMLLKLIILFIIVQTLKGRVVVPAVMSKSMNIHPLTDIFLVIGAIAAAGPFAAFSIVPLYSIIKKTIVILKNSDEL